MGSFYIAFKHFLFLWLRFELVWAWYLEYLCNLLAERLFLKMYSFFHFFDKCLLIAREYSRHYYLIDSFYFTFLLVNKIVILYINILQKGGSIFIEKLAMMCFVSYCNLSLICYIDNLNCSFFLYERLKSFNRVILTKPNTSG